MKMGVKTKEVGQVAWDRDKAIRVCFVALVRQYPRGIVGVGTRSTFGDRVSQV